MAHSNFFLYSTFWGEIVDDNEGSKIYGFENQSIENMSMTYKPITIPSIGGCFLVVQEGSIITTFEDNPIKLGKNCWQSSKNGLMFNILPNSKVVVFQRLDYTGMDNIGTIEHEGRLNYIDGCKDTLLFQPIKFGLPCLNALFMPNGVHQTMHTHPSTRAGIILEGKAVCVTPQAEYSLSPGMIFYLPTDGLHKFRTDYAGSSLKLSAYHPDSDVGPTDDNHAMINRTIVEGKSARYIDQIKTR